MDALDETGQHVASSKSPPVESTSSKSETSRPPERKRPSFLADLRDRKKFNPGKSKAVARAIPVDAEIIEITYPNVDAHGSGEEVQSRDRFDSLPDPVSRGPDKKRQMNWLASGSRENSVALLSKSSENKQRKATLAMRYGW